MILGLSKAEYDSFKGFIFVSDAPIHSAEPHYHGAFIFTAIACWQ
jgi:hypothetical protein